jgi:hypothetical protein
MALRTSSTRQVSREGCGSHVAILDHEEEEILHTNTRNSTLMYVGYVRRSGEILTLHGSNVG